MKQETNDEPMLNLFLFFSGSTLVIPSHVTVVADRRHMEGRIKVKTNHHVTSRLAPSLGVVMLLRLRDVR